MRHAFVQVLLVPAVLAGCASTVLARPIIFTTIAFNDGAFPGLDKAPTINDSGVVAFAVGDIGIFTGAGGRITTIADTSGPFSSFPS